MKTRTTPLKFIKVKEMCYNFIMFELIKGGDRVMPGIVTRRKKWRTVKRPPQETAHYRIKWNCFRCLHKLTANISDMALWKIQVWDLILTSVRTLVYRWANVCSVGPSLNRFADSVLSQLAEDVCSKSGFRTHSHHSDSPVSTIEYSCNTTDCSNDHWMNASSWCR